MPPERVSYCDGETTLIGRLIRPSRPLAPSPAVVLLPTSAGIDELIGDKAQAISQLGYAVFIADMQGQGALLERPEQRQAATERALADRRAIRRRVALAVARIELDPMIDDQRVAVVGYGLGGLAALEYARSGAHASAIVSMHGPLAERDPSLPAHPIPSSVLILHGHDDPQVSPDDVLSLQQELSECQADWSFHTFGGAMQAFTDPQANDPERGEVYHYQADQRAWTALCQFLAQQLG